MASVKCGFCDGVIAYTPYTESIGGQEYSFHARAWAEAMKASKFARWEYCGGLVAYTPYTENIGGKSIPFHAKACAEAFKKAEQTVGAWLPLSK